MAATAQSTAPPILAQHFSSVAISNPNVLKSIVDRLSKRDTRNLRNVNSCFRVAVNRTVSSLCYTLESPHPRHDLVDVFPEADRLVCDFVVAGPPIEHVELLLESLPTSSPGLIRKLRVLKLNILKIHLSKLHAALDDFLPRFVLGSEPSTAFLLLWAQAQRIEALCFISR
jgi:hypothetical protein